MDKDMTVRDMAVLAHIQSLSIKEGYCYASNRAICETLNLPDRSLYRILNKLEEKRLIKRVTRSIGKTGKQRRIYPVATATVAD